MTRNSNIFKEVLRIATIPIDREAIEFNVNMAGGIAEPQERALLSPDDVAKIQEDKRSSPA
jgi:hypothetical protein